MSRVTKTKPTTRSGESNRVRFPGICKEARELGVSRNHLYQVLVGNRVSKDLMERYEAYKKANRVDKKQSGKH